MIRLFSLKQKKDGADPADRGGSQKKASAAQLRIQKGPAYCFNLIFYSPCLL